MPNHLAISKVVPTKNQLLCPTIFISCNFLSVRYAKVANLSFFSHLKSVVFLFQQAAHRLSKRQDLAQGQKRKRTPVLGSA
jgi:hypothetical protein